MSDDTDQPPEPYWLDNVIRDPDPGQETWTPVSVGPIPNDPATPSDSSPATAEVTVIGSLSDTDATINDGAIETDDDSELDNPLSSPVVHTWQFVGEAIVYSFLFVVTLVCVVLLDVVAVRSWRIPTPAVVIATIVLLGSATWLYAQYMRRADRRWDESNLSELDEEVLYDRIPHISMFLNSIVVQAIIWVVSFALISIALHAMSSTWQWHVLIQAVVTAINAYFVTRTYVNWTRTRYIVTRASVIIVRPDLFWLRLRNNPHKEILAHTLVNHSRRQSTLSEKFAYNTRGTAILTTQEEGAGNTIILPYISGIKQFIDAASASRKSGRT